MKKIYTLVCAMAAFTTLSAEKVQSKEDNVSEGFELKQLSIETNKTPDAPMLSEAEMLSNVRKVTVADGEKKTINDSQYYFTDGLMYAGVSPTGGLYYPKMIIPYADSVVWRSLYTNDVAPAWTVTTGQGTTVKEESSYTYSASYSIGNYYQPQVEAGTYTTDTTITQYEAYTYGGDYASKSYVMSGFRRGDGLPMTLCQMWRKGGQDMYQVGAGTAGKYCYGTNLVASSGRMDTMLQIVRGTAPMCIDGVYIPIYGQKTDSIGSMLPNDAKIKLELLAVEGNKIIMNDVLGTAYVGAEDFTQSASRQYTGTLYATFFVMEDEFEVSKSITTTNSFALMITGYNEQECNFGINSDYYCPINGTTYYKKNGKFTTLWNGDGNNLAISYDAYYPVLTDKEYQDFVPEKLEAPIGGELAFYSDTTTHQVIDLYTNTDYNDWEITAVDAEGNEVEWVKLVSDTTYYGSDDVVMIAFATEPLPEGTEYREAVVSISVDGITYSRTITQGTATGIKAIANEETKKSDDKKFVFKNNDLYINKNNMEFDLLGRKAK